MISLSFLRSAMPNSNHQSLPIDCYKAAIKTRHYVDQQSLLLTLPLTLSWHDHLSSNLSIEQYYSLLTDDI